jgi:hypothetical protein
MEKKDPSAFSKSGLCALYYIHKEKTEKSGEKIIKNVLQKISHT